MQDKLYTNRIGAVGIGCPGAVGSRKWGCPSPKAIWWDLRLASLLMHLLQCRKVDNFKNKFDFFLKNEISFVFSPYSWLSHMMMKMHINDGF